MIPGIRPEGRLLLQVESRCGAVAKVRHRLLPALSIAGASISDHAPFPHPAHRTVHAELPHTALRPDRRALRPQRETTDRSGQVPQPILLVELHVGVALAPTPLAPLPS